MAVAVKKVFSVWLLLRGDTLGWVLGKPLPSESEIRGTLRFLPQLEVRPSSNAPSPVESREAPPTSHHFTH